MPVSRRLLVAAGHGEAGEVPTQRGGRARESCEQAEFSWRPLDSAASAWCLEQVVRVRQCDDVCGPV